jgi:hypothetical protein
VLYGELRDALRRHKDGVVGFSRALADWSGRGSRPRRSVPERERGTTSLSEIRCQEGERWREATMRPHPRSDADDARNVPMVCRRGDVLVHHCLVIHSAGVNATPDRHRRSLGFSYR